MSRQVSVLGAGIAGPTIVYWLLQRGFTPVLLERASEFREGGYITDFWGVGFDVAERMGSFPCCAVRATSSTGLSSWPKMENAEARLGATPLECLVKSPCKSP
jgi:2-polyprenyl-6-methoxyphenol hydroxylase-like FAD-dependent oxidoreductase